MLERWKRIRIILQQIIYFLILMNSIQLLHRQKQQQKIITATSSQQPLLVVVAYSFSIISNCNNKYKNNHHHHYHPEEGRYNFLSSSTFKSPLSSSSLLLLSSSPIHTSSGIQHYYSLEHQQYRHSNPIIPPPVQLIKTTATTPSLLSSTRRRISSSSSRLPLPTFFQLAAAPAPDTDSSTDYNDEDIQRWERMYYEKDQTSTATRILANDDDDDDDDDDEDNKNIIKKERKKNNNNNNNNRNGGEFVRVITFDLDNTIWKTKPTIMDANDALHNFLLTKISTSSNRNSSDSNNNDNNKNNNNNSNIKRTEQHMKELFEKNPQRYGPIKSIRKKQQRQEQVQQQQLTSKNTSTTTATTKSAVIAAATQLTLLRKDAIEQVLLQQGGSKNDNHHDSTTTTTTTTTTSNNNKMLIDEAFDVWMKARQESIQQNLASSVLDSLKYLREAYTTAATTTTTTNKVIVGAITDGNSNPLEMEYFKNYFDFCVNAEMVGVLKPDKKIYLHTAKEYIFPLLVQQHDHHQQEQLPFAYNNAKSVPIDKIKQLIGTGISDNEDDDDINTIFSQIEELIGPWWVHIGDDFIKDIVAAKNLNIRTIWCRELIREEEAEKERKRHEQRQNNNNNNNNNSQDDDVSNFVKKISEMGKIIEMQVGTDDYLMETIQNEFCDAVTDQFSSITGIIDRWNTDATIQKSILNGDTVKNTNNVNTKSGILEVYYPDDNDSPLDADLTSEVLQDIKKQEHGKSSDTTKEVSSFAAVINNSMLQNTTSSMIIQSPVDDKKSDSNKNIEYNEQSVSQQQEQQQQQRDYKFCIFCGEKLPSIAKFCSACGTKQDV